MSQASTKAGLGCLNLYNAQSKLLSTAPRQVTNTRLVDTSYIQMLGNWWDGWGLVCWLLQGWKYLLPGGKMPTPCAFTPHALLSPMYTNWGWASGALEFWVDLLTESVRLASNCSSLAGSHSYNGCLYDPLSQFLCISNRTVRIWKGWETWELHVQSLINH